MDLDYLTPEGNSSKIFQMKIHLTDECGLRCKFCPNSDTIQNAINVSSVETVIKHINFAIELGYSNIELGVLIGDVLNYDLKSFSYIINYLEKHDNVKLISIVTSLINLTPTHIKIFNQTKKISLKISWYGNDRKQYNRITGRDEYNTFINNINFIKQIKNFKSVIIMQMFNTTDDSSISGIKIEKQPIFKWPNKIETPKNGVCRYIYSDIGILHTGDITLCGWVDISGGLILGSINDGKEFILNKIQTYIKMHSINAYPDVCSKCEFFVNGVDLIE